MKVKIVSSQEILFHGEAHEVVLPGYAGEFSVMDFHQSSVHSLRRGQIKVGFKDRRIPKKRFFIHKGIAQVSISELRVLVEKYSYDA